MLSTLVCVDMHSFNKYIRTSYSALSCFSGYSSEQDTHIYISWDSYSEEKKGKHYINFSCNLYEKIPIKIYTYEKS